MSLTSTTHVVKSVPGVKDRSDKIVELAVWIIAITAMVAVLYPVMNVIALSLSDYIATIRNPARVIPGNFNVRAYQFLLFEGKADVLFQSLNITVLMVGVGTGLSMLVTIMLAFSLSRRGVPGMRLLTRLVVLSGIFTPSFIAIFLVFRWMQVYNTFWALVIPNLINMYHIIILKSFFQQVPKSLEDSAVVDGASFSRILWQIFVPISKPAITTVLLFTLVTYWNSFLNAVLFTRDRRFWTIQLLLREIVISADVEMLAQGEIQAQEVNFQERLRFAMLILTMVPIVIIYPFLQRHFTHGIMLGSLKG
jgi:putative aldouronate transport system permease protein